MRSTVCVMLTALLATAACRTEPAPPVVPAPENEIRASASPAPVEETTAEPCPVNGPRGVDAASVFRGAIAVCVDGKRFEGEAFRELKSALGEDARPGGPRKCQIGYPQVEAIDADGTRVNVAFCGQTGSGVAYLDGNYRLWIADPQAVDRWLRARGFDIVQREYPTLEERSSTW